MSGPKVFKSKTFTTPAFRAVFPDLNKPDKFDTYKVDVDCTTEIGTAIEETVAQQISELIPRAIKDFGIDEETVPENSPVRVGESKDGTPFRRLSFKMKATKKVKGREVDVKPRLVDAKTKPMNEIIFGGSLVKVGYYIQCTLVNGSFFASVRLNAVQVLEHVGPGGEVAIEQMFGEEDGFETKPETDDADDTTANEADEDTGSSDASSAAAAAGF